MNLLILTNKAEYDREIASVRLQTADFACYAEGRHFVIVKDRFGDRVGTCVTAPMLSNILASL